MGKWVDIGEWKPHGLLMTIEPISLLTELGLSYEDGLTHNLFIIKNSIFFKIFIISKYKK